MAQARTSSKDGSLKVSVAAGQAVTAAGITINGTYGTLFDQADGSYTYTLNSRNATVNALLFGRHAVKAVQLPAVDTDGSSSTAKLIGDGQQQ